MWSLISGSGFGLVASRRAAQCRALGAALALWGVGFHGAQAAVPVAASTLQTHRPSQSQAELSLAGALLTLVQGPKRLLATEGQANEQLGVTMAISGNTAVVGAPFSASSRGAAYVFVRNGDVWTQQQKLEAMDGKANDNFGASVAIAGDTVVVGADLVDSGTGMNLTKDTGAAYVFVRNGTTWTQQQKLEVNDGTTRDYFGGSVATSGDTVVIGAPSADPGMTPKENAGAVYVFVRQNNMWTKQQKLEATDGKNNENFGVSVAIAGDTVVAGAPYFSASKGAAYVWIREGAQWNEKQKLVADDAGEGDWFGNTVAINGDTVVVGAPFADLGAGITLKTDAGAVYLFTKSGATWGQKQKLTAFDDAQDDNFGASIATTGDTVVIGAPYADLVASGATLLDAGATYVFTKSGATWTQQQKLTATDGVAGDHLGASVAIESNQVLAGAPFTDANSKADVGALYPFSGEACGQAGECLSGFCVEGVCCDSACGGGDATDCMACSIAKGAAQNGVCGPVVKAADFICRASTGEGDAAERCDGTALTCPADAAPPEESSSGCRCQAGAQSALSLSTWLLPAALLGLFLSRRRRAS